MPASRKHAASPRCIMSVINAAHAADGVSETALGDVGMDFRRAATRLCAHPRYADAWSCAARSSARHGSAISRPSCSPSRTDATMTSLMLFGLAGQLIDKWAPGPQPIDNVVRFRGPKDFKDYV